MRNLSLASRPGEIYPSPGHITADFLQLKIHGYLVTDTWPLIPLEELTVIDFNLENLQ